MPNDNYKVIAFREPRNGESWLDGSSTIPFDCDEIIDDIRFYGGGPRIIIERVEESASICDLSEPNVVNITVNVNVEPVEEVLSSLAGKLERAAAELRS